MEFPGKGTVQHTGTSDGVLRACGERAVYVYYGTQHCHPIGPVITARAGRQVLPVDVCPGREERASRAPQKRRTVNHRPINTAIASPSIEVQVGRWVKKPDSSHKRRTRRVRPLLSHVSRNDTKSHQKKGSTEEKTAETLWQEIDPALSAIAPRGPPLNGCLLPSSCLCVCGGGLLLSGYIDGFGYCEHVWVFVGTTFSRGVRWFFGRRANVSMKKVILENHARWTTVGEL